MDGKVTMPGVPHAITVKFADAKPMDVQRVGSKRGMGDYHHGASVGGAAKRHQFMGAMVRWLELKDKQLYNK
jgi:hypothetical protein